jgi:group I intron endonuclease
MIGIYKITSPSKKIYIGQSVNIEKRFIYYNNLICKQQVKLYNSFKKYGVNNHTFEILCKCEINELNNKERFYQDLFDVCSINGLNLTLTKSDDRSGKHSDETIKKMSIIQKTRKRKKLSEETKNKIRIKAIGRIKSEKTIEKLRKSMINREIYYHTDETKLKLKKIWETRRLTRVSDKTRKKMSISQKKRFNNSKLTIKN